MGKGAQTSFEIYYVILRLLAKSFGRVYYSGMVVTVTLMIFTLSKLVELFAAITIVWWTLKASLFLAMKPFELLSNMG